MNPNILHQRPKRLDHPRLRESPNRRALPRTPLNPLQSGRPQDTSLALTVNCLPGCERSNPFVQHQPPTRRSPRWRRCRSRRSSLRSRGRSAGSLAASIPSCRPRPSAMLERWGDRYCLIGPYNPNTADVEFEEQPTYGSIRETLQRLRDAGIPCHFGRWLIAGRPRVILIDYRARFSSLGQRQVPALERPPYRHQQRRRRSQRGGCLRVRRGRVFPAFRRRS